MQNASIFQLTMSGWVETEEKSSDTIETWKRETRFFEGKLIIDYSLQWAHPDWPLADRQSLRDEFPQPEGTVSARIAEVHWEVPG